MRFIIIALVIVVISLVVVASLLSSALAESAGIYDYYNDAVGMRTDLVAQLEDALFTCLPNYTTISPMLQERCNGFFRLSYDPSDQTPLTYHPDLIGNLTGKDLYMMTGADLVNGYHLVKLQTLYDTVPEFQKQYPNLEPGVSVSAGVCIRSKTAVVNIGSGFNFTTDELIDAFSTHPVCPFPNATQEHRAAVRRSLKDYFDIFPEKSFQRPENTFAAIIDYISGNANEVSKEAVKLSSLIKMRTDIVAVAVGNARADGNS